MVRAVGLEPTVLVATDLQSAPLPIRVTHAFNWLRGQGSNLRQMDYESTTLPTELPRL